jgi:Fe-S-cluster containining protein
VSHDPFRNYRALVARIDAHHARVAQAHPLRCARGCSACCYVRLTVSRVEADHIRSSRPSVPARASRGALDDHPLFERLAGLEPCPFLGPEGDCAIYEARPLICRSHGLPLRIDDRIDACPLNGDLAGAPALSLEVVNTTLAAIDAVYCRETGRPAERVALADLAREVEEEAEHELPPRDSDEHR